VLVEEYLKGREVTNGVFTKDGVVKALPITEIITKNSFFDYKAKYEGDSKEVTPAEIDADLTIAIQENTKRIYQLLGMKGMSRIDYIITSKGFYMLEVNSIPGLSEESIIPQQARASGYTLEEFFTISIEECLRK
jgi:D-alanine-D-alanine ligase